MKYRVVNSNRLSEFESFIEERLIALREAGNKNRGNFEEQLKLQKQIQNFNKRGKEKNAPDVRISV